MNKFWLAAGAAIALSWPAHGQFASGAWTVEAGDGFAAAFVSDANTGQPLAEIFCESGEPQVSIIIHDFAPGEGDGADVTLTLAAGDAAFDAPAWRRASGADEAATIVAAAPSVEALWSVLTAADPLRIRAAGFEGQINDEGGRAALAALRPICGGA